MTDTAKMRLALLEAGQAQKHVTVNEALARIDALASRRLEGFGIVTPASAPAEGDAWVVGTGATGEWSGQDGRIAMRVNGGWEFLAPFAGLDLWDAGASMRRFYDGTEWHSNAAAVSSRGAGTLARVVEHLHPVGSGSTSATPPIIPDKAVVLGVTARVDTEILGALSWQLGLVESPDRYGSGLGTAAGSFVHGVSGSPIAYYGGTSLLLTAEGGSFAGGAVHLSLHLLEIVPPRPL